MEQIEEFFIKNNFKDIRNQVFKEFYNEIIGYGQENTNFLLKYQLYLLENNNTLISVKGFTFFLTSFEIFLKNDKQKKFQINFETIKIINFYDKMDVAHEEYICNSEYLKYIIHKVYQMNNPQFSNDEDSTNTDKSTISITDENISNFINYNAIYDSKHGIIDYKEIKKLKEIEFSSPNEKIKDKYFLKLVGLDKFQNIEQMMTDPSLKYASIAELLSNIKKVKTETIIFHNGNDFLPFNVLAKFDGLYNRYHYKYLYIDFNLFEKLNHNERLEHLIYCLLSLFPIEYSDFEKFVENNIKDFLTKNVECLSDIIPKVINYIKNNILKDKNNKEDSTKLKDDIYYIIFNDVDNEEYFKIIKKIIDECDLKNNFRFFIIIPLSNTYTINQFFEFISQEKKIFFSNYINIERVDQYIKEDISISPGFFSEDKKEQNLYDLLRIYHFEKIFCNGNNYPVSFLKKYMKFINIQFDNIYQKINKIAFKNETILKYFDEKYEDLLRFVKIKQEHKYENINKQMDQFELEKLIISEIISDKKDFKVLYVKSIFGLQEIQKEENINYQFINFIIKQKCATAEVFDFAIKIIVGNKSYLKLFQVTSFKSEDDLKKLCLERLKVYISYIIKLFKENNLGEIDGTSFGIITFTEIYGSEQYKDLKKFCKTNNYEFVLFNLQENSFKIRENQKYIDYNNGLYTFNNIYDLNVLKFENIIQLNNNISLRMLSTRNVPGRDETKEDEEAQKKYNIYTDNNDKIIIRSCKLGYYGKFNDLKRLNEDFLVYYYSKDKKYYFYNNEIKSEGIIDQLKNRITIVLYSQLNQLKEYINSSVEIGEEKNISEKKSKKKLKEEKQKPEKDIGKIDDNNNISINYEEKESDSEEPRKKKKYKRKREKKPKTLNESNLGKKHYKSGNE